MWEPSIVELSCPCGGTLRAPYVLLSDKRDMIERFHAAHEVCRINNSDGAQAVAPKEEDDGGASGREGEQ